MIIQRFENQVAIVTGGAHGIGRATVLRFSREGAAVAVVDMDLEAAERVAEEIRANEGEALALQVDVTQRSQVEGMLAAVVERFGRVDVLANIAGIGWAEPFLEIQEENWQKILNVNLNGVFYCSQVVARYMAEEKIPGRIVNMASTNGLVGEGELAHYNASKFGVVGLTLTMAIDLAPYNIRVNSVCPGLIETRLTQPFRDNAEWAKQYLKGIPVRRFGKPEEVASAVAYLASEDSGFITGHQLVVDGGQITFTA